MNINAELKNIKVEVLNKRYKKLAPTNLLVARRLVSREKARWIKENEVIMLLKTKKDFKKLKAKIIEEEGRQCYICGKIIPENEYATIDHMYPKCRCGKDTRDNLHCCCKRCNDDKKYCYI